MSEVVVEPMPVGWRVRASAGVNDLFFLTGRSAEAGARQLALKLAEGGTPTRLRLMLRDGSIAARFLCLPPLSAGASAIMVDAPR